MRKSKGFTLIEIIVAVACSTILIGGITACFMLMSKLNSNVMDSSANLYKIASVRDYIVNHYDDTFSSNITYDSDGNGTSSLIDYTDGDVVVTVSGESTTVASNTQITGITFSKDSSSVFTYCNISYNDGADKIYSFVVATSST